MKLTILKDLFRPAPQPAPTFDANDPKAPWNIGWTRQNKPEPRLRFRLNVPLDRPAALPGPAMTGRRFHGGE